MLNKLILRAFLSISLAFSFTGAANATLINQNILDAGSVIGNIVINTNDAVLFDVDDSYVESFVSFKLFDIELLDLTAFSLDNPLFEAHFNHNDLFSGLETLDFDLTDVFGAFYWAGSIWLDPSFNYIDVFDGPNSIILFSPDVTLGAVTVVSEPKTLILLLTGLIALRARRKTK